MKLLLMMLFYFVLADKSSRHLPSKKDLTGEALSHASIELTHRPSHTNYHELSEVRTALLPATAAS